MEWYIIAGSVGIGIFASPLVEDILRCVVDYLGNRKTKSQ